MRKSKKPYEIYGFFSIYIKLISKKQESCKGRLKTKVKIAKELKTLKNKELKVLNQEEL